MATGTHLDANRARQILSVPQVQSGAGNTSAPSGLDGLDMAIYTGAVRVRRFMLTLVLLGGATVVLEAWGLRTVWGSLGVLNGTTPLAGDKTYHFILSNVGLFDRWYLQCVSGNPTTWDATLTEIFEEDPT